MILEKNKEIFAYIRSLENEKLLVICNFTENNTNFNLDREIDSKSRELLISNYPVDINEPIENIDLKPYEARMYKLSL